MRNRDLVAKLVYVGRGRPVSYWSATFKNFFDAVTVVIGR